MATYFYSARDENNRIARLARNGPVLSLPGDLFSVTADDGEEIHIPTSYLSRNAVVTITQPTECSINQKYHYTVLVYHQKAGSRLSSSSKDFVTQAASSTASNATSGALAGVVASGATRFAVGFAAGMGTGAVVGSALGARKTGSDATHYDRVETGKSVGGKHVVYFIKENR